MNTVIFKTESAVLQFDKKVVMARFEILATEYGVSEAVTILKRMSLTDAESKLIRIEHEYFGYVVLELIVGGKGSVTCILCDKTYKPCQLQEVTIGAGKSPFVVNPVTKGGVKGPFTKNRKIPLFGGNGYECPAGHQLISAITWRT